MTSYSDLIETMRLFRTVFEILKRSRDSNHNPFVCRLGLAMIYIQTKIEVSS